MAAPIGPGEAPLWAPLPDDFVVLTFTQAVQSGNLHVNPCDWCGKSRSFEPSMFTKRIKISCGCGIKNDFGSYKNYGEAVNTLYMHYNQVSLLFLYSVQMEIACNSLLAFCLRAQFGLMSAAFSPGRYMDNETLYMHASQYAHRTKPAKKYDDVLSFGARFTLAKDQWDQAVSTWANLADDMSDLKKALDAVAATKALSSAFSDAETEVADLLLAQKEQQFLDTYMTYSSKPDLPSNAITYIYTKDQQNRDALRIFKANLELFLLGADAPACPFCASRPEVLTTCQGEFALVNAACPCGAWARKAQHRIDDLPDSGKPLKQEAVEILKLRPEESRSSSIEGWDIMEHLAVLDGYSPCIKCKKKSVVKIVRNVPAARLDVHCAATRGKDRGNKHRRTVLDRVIPLLTPLGFEHFFCVDPRSLATRIADRRTTREFPRRAIEL